MRETKSVNLDGTTSGSSLRTYDTVTACSSGTADTTQCKIRHQTPLSNILHLNNSQTERRGLLGTVVRQSANVGVRCYGGEFESFVWEVCCRSHSVKCSSILRCPRVCLHSHMKPAVVQSRPSCSKTEGSSEKSKGANFTPAPW